MDKNHAAVLAVDRTDYALGPIADYNEEIAE